MHVLMFVRPYKLLGCGVFLFPLWSIFSMLPYIQVYATNILLENVSYYLYMYISGLMSLYSYSLMYSCTVYVINENHIPDN